MPALTPAITQFQKLHSRNWIKLYFKFFFECVYIFRMAIAIQLCLSCRKLFNIRSWGAEPTSAEVGRRQKFGLKKKLQLFLTQRSGYVYVWVCGTFSTSFSKSYKSGTNSSPFLSLYYQRPRYIRDASDFALSHIGHPEVQERLWQELDPFFKQIESDVSTLCTDDCRP